MKFNYKNTIIAVAGGVVITFGLRLGLGLIINPAVKPKSDTSKYITPEEVGPLNDTFQWWWLDGGKPGKGITDAPSLTINGQKANSFILEFDKDRRYKRNI